MNLYIIIALLVIAMLLIITNIRIVPQSHAVIIERLGTYVATWQTGLHVKVPFIDRIANKVSLKEKGSGLSATAGYYKRQRYHEN